jgi:hypothetical protein
VTEIRYCAIFVQLSLVLFEAICFNSYLWMYTSKLSFQPSVPPDPCTFTLQDVTPSFFVLLKYILLHILILKDVLGSVCEQIFFSRRAYYDLVSLQLLFYRKVIPCDKIKGI